MTTWQEDKKWSDQFLPEIKMILAEHLIGEPPEEEDAIRNTDLIVLKMEPARIACRIRSPEYCKYKDEFTIRLERPSGTKTELSKILEGWGDYFFYGIADYNRHLQSWGLGDLNVFRLWFNQRLFCLDKGLLPGKKKCNPDSSSNFLVFKWHEISESFIVASSNIEVETKQFMTV